MSTIKSALQFSGYRITNLQFKYNPGYSHNAPDADDLAMHFKKVLHRTGEKDFQLVLMANIFTSEETEGERNVDIQASMIGKFHAEPEFDEKWEPNALAIMFPYLRSFITSISSQAGFDAIVLPTINIAALFEQNKTPAEGKSEEMLPEEQQ